ncbi:MAG: hypothetical protein JWM95_2553 [Gemmatimonadetes bacterium]|nr:hypothetical protein [Gemmatimonadota bacterium]
MTYPDRSSSPSPLSPAPTSVDRERVVQQLSLHFAADHLSLDELEDRLKLAYESASLAQLDALASDLPAIRGEDLAPGYAPMYAPSGTVPERGVVIAVLGGTSRKGSWIVPRHLKVFAVLGGCEIDLREARFAPGVTEMDCTAIMGGIEVTVPPGVRVESIGGAFMGGFEASGGDDLMLDPTQPVLRVSGLALMGGVQVKVRGPSKKMLARYEAAVRGLPPG